MMRVNSTLEGLARCPQCNIANPLLEYRSVFFEDFTGSSNTKAWFSYKCSSCNDLVAAKAVVPSAAINQNMVKWLNMQKLVPMSVIPTSNSIDKDLPDRPRIYLEQAVQSLHAPDGAIMLAGSAIDAMLKLKGYSEGSVYIRINKAVKDNILTEGMSEWAHAVRLESNKPRHADIDEPHATKELAEQTIKFALALGEYLFALPARINRGKEDSVQANATSPPTSE